MPEPTRRWYRATRRRTRESVIFDLTEINDAAGNEYNVAREAFKVANLTGITVESYTPDKPKLKHCGEALGCNLYYEAKFL